METQGERKAKRRLICSFSLLCVFLAGLVVLILLYKNRPVSPQLTMENVQSAMNDSAYQVLMQGTCYFLETEESLSSCCEFDSWEPGKPAVTGTHIMTFKLAEEYELAFYEGGAALVYDGYSGWKYRGKIWYTVPETAIKKLEVRVTEHGIPQEMYLGPASWFAITE